MFIQCFLYLHASMTSKINGKIERRNSIFLFNWFVSKQVDLVARVALAALRTNNNNIPRHQLKPICIDTRQDNSATSSMRMDNRFHISSDVI